MAGVSQSTVDRVLNERGSVSKTARDNVLAAAKSLRIPRILPEPWHGKLNIEVILPRNPTPFWHRLDEAVQAAGRRLPRHMTVHRSFILENDEEALGAAILTPVSTRAGLVIAAEITPRIYAALEKAIERGEHVVTLASDVPSLPYHTYCGVDNHAAGRTAGLLMSSTVRGGGKVLVLRANDWLAAHNDRTRGFIDAMREYAPSVELKIFVTREDLSLAARAVRAEMKSGNLVGIYDTGWVSLAIAPEVRRCSDRPKWIGHEFDPDHRSLMAEGLLSFVLDQDPVGQANAALGHMAKVLGVTDSPIYIPQPEVRLYCRENFPSKAE